MKSLTEGRIISRCFVVIWNFFCLLFLYSFLPFIWVIIWYYFLISAQFSSCSSPLCCCCQIHFYRFMCPTVQLDIYCFINCLFFFFEIGKIHFIVTLNFSTLPFSPLLPAFLPSAVRAAAVCGIFCCNTDSSCGV